MERFFQQIEDLRQACDDLAEKVRLLRKAQTDVLASVGYEPARQSQLDGITSEIKRTANSIRFSLKDLQSNLSAATATEVKILVNQQNMLTRRFIAIMEECHELQEDYRQRCKGRIRRQFEISGQHLSDTQMDDLLANGSQMQAFTQGIIRDSAQARATLADVDARHVDIVKLERSIAELHEMYTDVAMMVESQGDMVDRIHVNVETGQSQVTAGASQTRQTAVLAASARKWKCILYLILAIVALLVLGGIVYLVAQQLK